MKIIGDENTLIDEIISDAERKKEQAISKAEREAEKIVKEAEENSIEEYNKIKNNAAKKAKEKAEQIQTSVPQEIKKKNVQMFNSLVDEVINELPDYINKLDEKTRKDLELALLNDAADKVEKGSYSVLVNKQSKLNQKDIDKIGGKYGLKLKLKKIDNLDIGVILSSGDERMQFDNTYPGKLDRDIEEVRYKIYEILFENK